MPFPHSPGAGRWGRTLAGGGCRAAPGRWGVSGSGGQRPALEMGISSCICPRRRRRALQQIHGDVDCRAGPGEIGGPAGVGRKWQVWPVGCHASTVEVELTPREQQYVAHIGQVGGSRPRARFSPPRRSPRTMHRVHRHADKDKRQEQSAREDEGGGMCHAPVSAPRRYRANPGRGQDCEPELSMGTRNYCVSLQHCSLLPTHSPCSNKKVINRPIAAYNCG